MAAVSSCLLLILLVTAGRAHSHFGKKMFSRNALQRSKACLSTIIIKAKEKKYLCLRLHWKSVQVWSVGISFFFFFCQNSNAFEP